MHIQDISIHVTVTSADESSLMHGQTLARAVKLKSLAVRNVLQRLRWTPSTAWKQL